MTTPDRWEPDPMLVDAATAGRLHATRMPEPDRAYVIAMLTDRGESAEQIADRLHCSPRLVKRIRAEPLTITLQRAANTEHLLHLAETRLRQLDRHAEHAAATQAEETRRLRQQLDTLISDLQRTREALDHERAERLRRAEVHVHVYRRRPTPRQLATTGAPTLFD